MKPPLISICIPAYKNVDFLKRLLDSIVRQDFKDYEVIVTDDSPDNRVQLLIKEYEGRMPQLHYWKNDPAEGMPQNWNTALKKARGEWIKMMHDDDWFARADSLSQFASQTHTEVDFIFCNYENHYLEADGQRIKRTELVQFLESRSDLIKKEPLALLADNLIGPPSVCLVRANADVYYDPRLRWRVDIDYYVRILKQKPLMISIPLPLIAVGMNQDQVTNITKNIPEVELPEAFILMEKYGVRPFNCWQVYDSWWRMFRNMQIYSRDRLRLYADKDWHPVVLEMVDFIHYTPKFLLKTGATSKLFMLFSFFTNKGRK